MIAGWLTVTHHRQIGMSSRRRCNDLYSRSTLYEINQVSIYFSGDIIFARHHGVHASSAVDVGDPLQSVEIALTPVIGVSLNACVDAHLVFFHYEPASP